jgi:hypothetical protein
MGEEEDRIRKLEEELRQAEETRKRAERLDEELNSFERNRAELERLERIARGPVASEQFKWLTTKLATLDRAGEAIGEVEEIAGSAAEELKALKIAEENADSIKSLEDKIALLADTSTSTIEGLRKQSLSDSIVRLSILRPDVRLVDANLAHRYVDYQGETNILVGLMTLFGGIGLASVVSIIIAMATGADSAAIAIHATVIAMSAIVTIVFVLLTWGAIKRANEAREKFEADVGEREIPLALATDDFGYLARREKADEAKKESETHVKDEGTP